MKTHPLVIAISFIALFYTTAVAHVDDGGDVRPIVKSIGGRFDVYFKNTREEKWYVTSVSATGEILSERKEIPEKSFPRTIFPPVKIPADYHGIYLAANSQYFSIPKWERQHNGKPFLVKIAGGEVSRVNLEWGKKRIRIVHGAAVTEKWILLNVSEKPDSQPTFQLASFSAATKKLHQFTDVGDPIRIYDFPQVSPIVVEGSAAYIAWMGGGDDPFGYGDGKEILNLSKFDPQTGIVETKKISRGHWNSDPSVAIMGDHALIAFHRTPLRKEGDTGRGAATIVIEHVSLSEIFGSEAVSE